MTSDAERNLQSAYLRTEISITLPEVGWVRDVEALRALPIPVHVLTAWNPGAVRPGLVSNRENNRLLRDRLIESGAGVYPAIGSSPEGDHHEESYAATGLNREAAIALGREFGQTAIFELTSSHQIVLGCVKTWMRSRALVMEE